MSKIYLRFTNKGSLPGVPARDLTREEAKQFDEQQLVDSGCYSYVASKPQPSENKAEAAGAVEDKGRSRWPGRKED